MGSSRVAGPFLLEHMKYRHISIVNLLLIIAMAFLLFGALSCEENAPADDHTVEAVDLARYAGKWYEIASLPAPFQEDCFCTTAEYSLQKDHVKVLNQCRRGSVKGELDEAVGKAWPEEGSNNSRLKVSFFWPFKGDYWIIGLDQNYRWAMVGHPQRKYLWILSREPKMPEDLYQSLMGKAKDLGYDVSRLKLMVQECADQPNQASQSYSTLGPQGRKVVLSNPKSILRPQSLSYVFWEKLRLAIGSLSGGMSTEYPEKILSIRLIVMFVG